MQIRIARGPNRVERRRLAVGLALVAAASLTLASWALGGSPVRKKAVTCGEAISFENSLHYTPPSTQRIILGRVALRREEDIYFAGGPPYYAKFGMAIRSAKGSVLLTVPPAWRGRFAIGWGYKPKGQFDSIRFPSCVRPPTWPVYSGKFYVRQPACVPLNIRVGTLSRRVWLGIDHSCP